MSRTWYTVLAAAALAAGCATTPVGPGPAELAPEALLNRQEVVLTVHGLSCPLCSNNLDGQLRRLEGVEAAVIDLKTGAVTVRLATGHRVTPQDLERAVHDAGFTLKAIESAGAGK
jgi:copper chaperone CopZ